MQHRKIPVSTMLYPSLISGASVSVSQWLCTLSSGVYRYYTNFIFIGLKFKSKSKLISSPAASSILPTLHVCEWGMMGAVLSAGKRQHLAESLVKTSWTNPKITGELCGSPIRFQETSRGDFLTDWLTDCPVKRTELTGENRILYIYIWLTCPNEIMILRLFPALLFSGPSNILILWSGKEPGLYFLFRRPGFGWFLFLDVKFPKMPFLIIECGFSVLDHKCMRLMQTYVCVTLFVHS